MAEYHGHGATRTCPMAFSTKNAVYQFAEPVLVVEQMEQVLFGA